MMNHLPPPPSKKTGNSGNIFFMLFGAVALVGAIGAGTMNHMKGIVTSMSDVTRKTVAEEKMTGGARLSVMAATDIQANDGDCDSDGMVEPLPFVDAGTSPKPTGGGWLPANIGAEQTDPWGQKYGYCVWDAGAQFDQAGCGGPGARRLRGSGNAAHTVVAIISPGKNRKFETTCNAFVDTTPADGNPDTPLVGRAAGGDDIILEYSYEDANTLSGEDLWKIRDTDPGTAMIDKDIEVGGSGTFGGAINLMSEGLVLPADPGDDSVTGACTSGVSSTDQQLRVNTSTSPPSLEICHDNTWTPVSMGAEDEDGACEGWVTMGTGGTNGYWHDIASSANGMKLVAVTNGAGGYLYTSTDGGATWTPRQGNGNWSSVASSADGTKLVATVYTGRIYTSTDSGATWMPRDSNRNWWRVASSADGTKLVAIINAGQIYTSTDSGATWVPRETNRAWRDVASSADGTKLVATVYTGQIYTSTDSGVTWVPRESSRMWVGVASSADGTKLVATVSGGQIYTSTDSGVNWTPRDSNRNWYWVASSADGTKLIAPGSNERIYVSTDSGATWVPEESSRVWGRIASSSDGSKLFTFTNYGELYIKNCGGTEVYDPQPVAPIAGPLTAPDFLACSAGGRGPFKVSGTLTPTINLRAHHNGKYLFTYDASNLYARKLNADGTFSSLGSIAFTGTASALWSDEDYVFLITDSAIRAYTFNGTAFTAAGNTSSSGATNFLPFNQGDYFFAPAGSAGITAYRYDGTTFTNLATFDTSGNVYEVWGDGTYLYVSDYTGGFRILTFDGTAFTEVTSITPGGDVYTSWGDGNYIYIGTSTNLYAYRFASDTLTLAGTYAGGTVRKIWGNGSTLFAGYLTTGDIKALTFDGTSFQTLGVYAGPGQNLSSITGDGNYVYATWAATRNLTAFSGFGCGQTMSPDPAVILAANKYRGKIGGGQSFSCGIKSDNTAWCWGSGGSGQRGDGTTTGSATSPVPVASSSAPNSYVAVTAGQTHACALTPSADAYCWGADTSGVLGNGPGVTATQTLPNYIVSNGHKWSSISAGLSHNCAVRTDGTIWCWGADSSGQLGNGAGGNQDVPGQITDAGPWTFVSSGASGSCGIKTDGSAWCWGSAILGNGTPGSSQTPVPVAEPGPWVLLSVGSVSACGIKTDGSAWCWGSGTNGLLGNGATANRTVPVRVADSGPWIAISVGNLSACGIKIDGALWCWGSDSNGRLGNGTTLTADQLVPSRVIDPGPWAEVKVNTVENACGIKVDGSLWCWGRDFGGELGNGASLTADQASPSRVANFSNLPSWQWNAAQTFITKTVSTASNVITPGASIGYDGTDGGFGFTSDGQSILRNPNGNTRMIVGSLGTPVNAQISFKAASAGNTRSIGIDSSTGNLEFGLNNASVTTWMSGITPHMVVTPSGAVGLGLNTVNAGAALDVTNGGLRVGNDSRTCAPSRAGTLRFASDSFEYCDGAAWVDF